MVLDKVPQVALQALELVTVWSEDEERLSPEETRFLWGSTFSRFPDVGEKVRVFGGCLACSTGLRVRMIAWLHAGSLCIAQAALFMEKTLLNHGLPNMFKDHGIEDEVC